MNKLYFLSVILLSSAFSTMEAFSQHDLDLVKNKESSVYSDRFEPEWENGVFADLKGANLIAFDLEDANLFGADLSGAELISAKLMNADLENANLTEANLSFANLTEADLKNTNLAGAKIGGARFHHANFHDTIMPDGSKRNMNH